MHFEPHGVVLSGDARTLAEGSNSWIGVLEPSHPCIDHNGEITVRAK